MRIIVKRGGGDEASNGAGNGACNQKEINAKEANTAKAEVEVDAKKEGKVEAEAEAKAKVEEEVDVKASAEVERKVEGMFEKLSIAIKITNLQNSRTCVFGPFPYHANNNHEQKDTLVISIDNHLRHKESDDFLRPYICQFKTWEEKEEFYNVYKIIHEYYNEMINLPNDREVENTHDASFESATSVATTDTAIWPYDIHPQERAHRVLQGYLTGAIKDGSDGSSVVGGSWKPRDTLSVEDASNEENRELEKITGAISNLLH